MGAVAIKYDEEDTIKIYANPTATHDLRIEKERERERER